MIACSCLASALLAVGGMTNGVQIARTPVTNAEFAEFANATGHSVPRYWKNGTFPKGKDKHPVVWVSYDDALDYCAWLSEKDPTRAHLPVYRHEKSYHPHAKTNGGLEKPIESIIVLELIV